MLKAVFVDMDNTLIETQVLYTNAQKIFVNHVCGFGSFSPEEVTDYFLKHQMVLFKTLGYSAQMLPQSYEDTLKHFVPDVTAAEIAEVRDFSKLVFERQAELKAGVETAIAVLSSHYPVYLVTVGDQTVQQARVDILPFKDTFAGIFIVEHKNAETYAQVLQTVGVKAKDAVMIGDSLNSDIIPALQNGMKAIYIPADNWVAREVSGADLPKKGMTTHVTFSAATVSLIGLKNTGPRRRPGGPSL